LAKDALHITEKISKEKSCNLVSYKKQFQLGFFSLPIGSSNGATILKKYLGIWYHDIEPLTVIWVANRDTPLIDTTWMEI